MVYFNYGMTLLFEALWVGLLLIAMLLLLWLAVRLYDHQKQLKTLLHQQHKRLQEVQQHTHVMTAQNKWQNTLLLQQLLLMQEQLSVLQSDYQEEMQVTGTVKLFSDYQKTLATYTRMWQKV